MTQAQTESKEKLPKIAWSSLQLAGQSAGQPSRKIRKNPFVIVTYKNAPIGIATANFGNLQNLMQNRDGEGVLPTQDVVHNASKGDLVSKSYDLVRLTGENQLTLAYFVPGNIVTQFKWEDILGEDLAQDIKNAFENVYQKKQNLKAEDNGPAYGVSRKINAVQDFLDATLIANQRERRVIRACRKRKEFYIISPEIINSRPDLKAHIANVQSTSSDKSEGNIIKLEKFLGLKKDSPIFQNEFSQLTDRALRTLENKMGEKINALFKVQASKIVPIKNLAGETLAYMTSDPAIIEAIGVEYIEKSQPISQSTPPGIRKSQWLRNLLQAS